MRTLGIDLAGPGSRTGLVWLRWINDPTSGRAVPVIDDVDVRKYKNEQLDLLAESMREVLSKGGWVAIDAPFGFPRAFTERVAASATGRIEPIGTSEVTWRVTEDLVRKEMEALGFPNYPLSTVTAMITGTVLRCLDLLSRVAETSDGSELDRLGFTSHVIETYPIACLRKWHLIGTKVSGAAQLHYKHDDEDKRDEGCAALAEAFCDRFPSLRTADEKQARLLKTSGDALDALTCALAAGFAGLDSPDQPTAAGIETEEDRIATSFEGWIHLPEADRPRLLPSEPTR